MLPMFSPSHSSEGRALFWAIAVSVFIHALVLLIPQHDPAGDKSLPRVEARLVPAAEMPVSSLKALPKAVPNVSKKPPARARVMTTPRPSKFAVDAAPKWSAAEKADMNRFLDELEASPKPTLAQRSMAAAREYAGHMARQDESGAATLELRPNEGPPDPFSLEMYVEGLIKRLNRSAAFVKNDPRSKGVRAASVQFRLNPDGSLKSFAVLNAGDQAEEIAFIKSVVERSIPFSPFPADINKSARSLAMTICILPASSSHDGFGFSRATSGRRC